MMIKIVDSIKLFLRQIAETLSPPICVVCGDRLPEEDKETPLCPECLSMVTFLQPTPTTLGIACYHEGPARILVHKFKYNRFVYLAPFMAQHMATALPSTRNLPFDALIPVPLWKGRQRERGFNQAELLTQQLQIITGIPSQPRILKRIRNTPTQTSLNRRQRKENIKGAFEIDSKNPTALTLIKGKHLLLVDDVCTTGATLNECANVLLSGGAKYVSELVFASPMPEEYLRD